VETCETKHVAMVDKNNYNLLAHNTFHVSATCRRFIEFASIEELRQVFELLKTTSQPVLIIGAGSNLLFLRDFDGVVLHSAIRGIRVVEDSADGSVRVRCGSGEVWDDVVKWCVEHGYYGTENLSLIPGEVGATAVQNIGAYGVEAKDIIDTVVVFDLSTGETKTFANAECQYAYRNSMFKREHRGEYVVTSVTYRLSKTFRPQLDYGNIRSRLAHDDAAMITARQVRDVIIAVRQEKLPDPKVLGNAGSFFKNPVVSSAFFKELQARFGDIPHYIIYKEQVKIPAGWLIEQCGWRGKRVGNVATHDKQALVIVNNGGATGSEIRDFARQIQTDVHRKFSINIDPEVNIIE